MARVPLEKASNSKTPMGGPFQNTVLAPFDLGRECRCRFRTNVQANAGSTESAVLNGVCLNDLVLSIRSEAAGDYDVRGNHERRSGIGGPLEVVLDYRNLVFLEEAARNLVPGCCQEGEEHAAANKDGVRFAKQVVNDRQLV